MPKHTSKWAHHLERLEFLLSFPSVVNPVSWCSKLTPYRVRFLTLLWKYSRLSIHNIVVVRIDDEIHEQFLTKFKDLKVRITYYCARVYIDYSFYVTPDWRFRYWWYQDTRSKGGMKCVDHVQARQNQHFMLCTQIWRPFCNQFEGKVHDFNFGTLLRYIL